MVYDIDSDRYNYHHNSKMPRLRRIFLSPSRFLLTVATISAFGFYLYTSNLTANSRFVDNGVLDRRLEKFVADDNTGDSMDFKPETGLPLDLNYTRNISKLIFNRVGKCGSRSMVHTIDILARKNNFPNMKSQVFTQKRLNEQEQAEFVAEVDVLDPPYIYNRHIDYVDFSRFGSEQPYGINLIRDPLDRTISFYYYTRFGDATYQREAGATMKDLNQTFDECVLFDKEECSTNNTFRIIPYFCGQDDMCRVPSRWALETAIRHVVKDYVFVGILEDFENTLRILEIIMPQFFGGASEAYSTIVTKGDVQSFKSVSRKEPAEVATTIMKQRMAYEYEFYDFVKRRMELIKKQLHLT
ncbi:uronyl 2-sulfotransferase-like [Saccoglossus kowalevskii]|uniref:Uronyl 2-sulfotransferase-like isoform X1 n=1 Tax=Saccoglossus kowalevskii TaxID=10224 RepID=A0ABM0MV82_SACKO|nr:PREDICTED: uronyl 2-sulfotransferase-like isoform X1 [Saccoglossus kowalevskii]XP_006823923.1 PREDICTED: uronyl 2-sulfotransferase-like isoform X2 [Saccoglossus kowalevskii]XP_006823924.1 PREDICTED: uronyl 2-sulfotransferase-like isoform X3 [Saccoglossus kowalevskii]